MTKPYFIQRLFSGWKRYRVEAEDAELDYVKPSRQTQPEIMIDSEGNPYKIWY